MQKIKIIIVDDEPLAREVVKGYLKTRSNVFILAECGDGFECIKAVKNEKPDLIILDIQMPKIDGFELLEILNEKPEIIFATAYDQYAIRAFEANAVDYILKPFSKERFDAAFEKAVQRILNNSSEGKDSVRKLEQTTENPEKTVERIIIRKGTRIIVVPADRIKYIEAQDDYVMIHSGEDSFLKEKTMKFYEEHLPKDMFVRIHRSYIVNITMIDKLELYEKETYMIILKDGSRLRASRDGYKKLKEVI